MTVPPGATTSNILAFGLISNFEVSAEFGVFTVTQSPGYGTIQFSNDTTDDDTVTVWVVDEATNDTFGFTLAPGEKSGTGTLYTNNAYVYYVASWKAVAQHNIAFPDPKDYVDPTALQTAQTVNFSGRVATTRSQGSMAGRH